MGTFKINKVTISEETSNFDGETNYTAEVDFEVGTKALFDISSGVYRNPKLDLSKDSSLNAIIIYSKNDLVLDQIKQLTGETSTPASEVLQRNTIVEIQKLTKSTVRDASGELLKDLFVDYDAAQSIKKTNSQPITHSVVTLPAETLQASIVYHFSSKRNLRELYVQNETKNLYVTVVPIIYQSVDDKPPKITQYYSLKNTQVIENDIFIGDNEDLRIKFYENLFSFDLSGDKIQDRSMSSDLFLSFGKKSQVKGMFGIDKLNILRNMSSFGGLLQKKGLTDNDKRDISILSQILDLKIKRQKIKRLLGFAEREEKISQNFIEEVIASSREQPRTDELDRVENKDIKRNFLIGEMGELDLELSSGIKFVGFNDFDTSQEGLYRYSMDMSIKDGTKIYIDERIRDLEVGLKSLEEYYGAKYINKSPKAEDYREKAEGAATLISQVVTVLNDDAASLGESFTNSIANLINYQQSLLNLIEFTNNILKKLQALQGINTNQVNISKSRNLSKINSDKSVLFYSKQFDEYADFTDLKNINYDYVGIPENKQIGISVISNKDIKRRFGFEFFTKLIDAEQFDTFQTLQKKMHADTFGTPATDATTGRTRTDYFDLSQTYYGYLSPVQIRDQAISEENVFDPSVYNQLHYQELEGTSETKEELLYQLMSLIGISISSVFYKSLYEGLKSTSSTSLKPASLKFKNYDGKIDEVSDYIPLINSVLQKEEGWNISKDTYSTTNLKSNFKKSMPNHIRTLFGGKSDAIKGTKWLSTSGDYLKNPNTYYMMKQSFMNLIEVETLVFDTDSDGNIDLKNVTFGLLDSVDINSGTKIICKTQVLEAFDCGVQNSTYSDKYFIIEGGAEQEGSSIDPVLESSSLSTITVKNQTLNTRKKLTKNDTIETMETFKAIDVPDFIVKGKFL
jgi:hypothetical protein